MKNPLELEVKCEDSLKENHHFYVPKARRKKIALINVEAVNKSAAELQLLLGVSRLIVGDQTYNPVSRDIIVRKLSEFTWDFLFYLIFCFHPVEAAVDIFFFLFGQVYNRRLEKQLHSLSDGELLLRAGESKRVLVAFRDVPKGVRQLQLVYRFVGAEPQQIQCEVG